MPGRILIAGAGIGGLAAALCLKRAGQDVEIVERREHLEALGAGIQISPNASRILIDLGLGPALERVAVPGRTLTIRRLDADAPIASMALDQLARRHGTPYWLLRRADLQDALADAARAAGITIRFGEAVDSVTEEADGVSIATQLPNAATGRHHAALLVAADGLWSSAAKTPAPRFTGYEAWRALLPAANLPAGFAKPDVSLWLGQSAHIVAYPVASGAFLNLVLVRRDGASQAGWTRPGDPALLLPILKQATPGLRQLLERVADWQVWSLFDAPARAMVAGRRTALLGDAAHPVLPFLAQGAALAIEDAAVLAGLVTPQTLADPAALQPALQRYDRQRRPRAEKVQQAARSNGATYHLGWPAALARDAAMAILGSGGMMKRYDWLYGWSQQKN